MMRKINSKLVLASALATVLLSACFGGGDDTVAAPAAEPATTQPLPAAASSSSAGLNTFVADLVSASATNENSLPFDVATATLTADETAEPAAVN
jgi:hypothetical protein